MADQFPENIEIEVDRDALRAYLRATWLGVWVSALALLGCLFGYGSVVDSLGRYESFSIQQLGLLAQGIGGGLVVSFAVSTSLYFLLNHRLADRLATSLRVSVEGPFLRIVQEGQLQKTDRKLHFRSIVDYSTVEGYLMRRFGVMELRMTTTGGGTLTGPRIIGLKDCPRVRDMLAEIDSIRER